MFQEQAHSSWEDVCGLAPCQSLQAWLREPLTRTLGSPGLSLREDPLPPFLGTSVADSESLLLTLRLWSQVRCPFLPIANPWQVAVGGSRNWTGSPQTSSLHSPLCAQVTARVPGRGGWRGTDAFVVILHLEPNGPAQPPGDVQQSLHNELVFFLP